MTLPQPPHPALSKEEIAELKRLSAEGGIELVIGREKYKAYEHDHLLTRLLSSAALVQEKDEELARHREWALGQRKTVHELRAKIEEKDEEIARLKASIEIKDNAIASYIADRNTLMFGKNRADLLVADLSSVLGTVEWASMGEGQPFCPACWQVVSQGHSPSCTLKAALEKAGY